MADTTRAYRIFRTKSIRMIGLLTLVVAGVAVAEEIPWTYDDSRRVPETVSTGQATLTGFDSRCTSSQASPEDSLDSRFCDRGESETTGLVSTPPTGMAIVVR